MGSEMKSEVWASALYWGPVGLTGLPGWPSLCILGDRQGGLTRGADYSLPPRMVSTVSTCFLNCVRMCDRILYGIASEGGRCQNTKKIKNKNQIFILKTVNFHANFTVDRRRCDGLLARHAKYMPVCRHVWTSRRSAACLSQWHARRIRQVHASPSSFVIYSGQQHVHRTGINVGISFSMDFGVNLEIHMREKNSWISPWIFPWIFSWIIFGGFPFVFV